MFHNAQQTKNYSSYNTEHSYSNTKPLVLQACLLCVLLQCGQQLRWWLKELLSKNGLFLNPVVIMEHITVLCVDFLRKYHSVLVRMVCSLLRRSSIFRGAKRRRVRQVVLPDWYVHVYVSSAQLCASVWCETNKTTCVTTPKDTQTTKLLILPKTTRVI